MRNRLDYFQKTIFDGSMSRGEGESAGQSFCGIGHVACLPELFLFESSSNRQPHLIHVASSSAFVNISPGWKLALVIRNVTTPSGTRSTPYRSFLTHRLPKVQRTPSSIFRQPRGFLSFSQSFSCCSHDSPYYHRSFDRIGEDPLITVTGTW